MSKKVIYLISFVLALGLVSSASAELVGHWTLDEGSGTTVSDSSGNGNDGTIVGNPTWIAGVGGTALEFHGLGAPGGGGDYIDCGNDASLDITGPISIALWIRPGADDPEGNGTETAPMAKAMSGMSPSWSYQVRYGWGSPQPYMAFTFNTSPRAWAYVGKNLERDEWCHIACSHDGTTLKCYLDGEETDSTPMTEITSSSTPVLIGSDGWGCDWIGAIDDVRIYDHALSEVEILSTMAGEPWPYAFGPHPADGALYTDTWANLGWSPGDTAASHDVYFGDNFDDVNDGTPDSSGFRGNQPLTPTTFFVGFFGFPYPDGLVPGTTYYWRIDEVNDTDPNSPWKGDVWSFMVPPRTAYNPKPADGAKFTDPNNVELSWTAGSGAKLHYVYFGDNFDDVNSAVGALFQADTTYTPGTLEVDKTYYWRVDESDDAITMLKGDVWSFKTLPDVPLTSDPNLIGWWKFDEGEGTTALDWSGRGNHGTLQGNPQWVDGYDGGGLQCDGGGDWATTGLMPANFGLDGANAKTVTAWVYTTGFNNGGIYDMGSQSNGQEFCLRTMTTDNLWRIQFWGSPPDFDLDFTYPTLNLWAHLALTYDGTTARIYADGTYLNSFTPVLNTANAAFVIGRYGSGTGFNGIIDDVRLFNKALTQEEVMETMRGDPLLAGVPNPTNGSTPYIREATPLNWSAGENASGHDVYFGTDRDAVADANASDTTGVYRGQQVGTSYTPPDVEWGGGPYYWRIDEYNTDATIGEGKIWSFTVADFIVIEDFEDYNDFEPDRIFDTWSDGWGVDTNGSEVGYAEPNFLAGEHFVETTIVHGGSQSMPYFYENNFKYSEATYPPTQRDWTEEGVEVLSLWFYGDAANAAAPMYVALNGGTAVYHDNSNAALIGTWTEWTIDLQEFTGVGLTNVNTLAIGFGDKNNLQAGGSGLVLFDDIRLYRPEPEPETP